MTNGTWESLDRHFQEWPEDVAGAVPAEEVDVALEGLGLAVPVDFREFLCRYGAAMVGAYPIFGMRPVEDLGNSWSLLKNNAWFRQQGWPGVDSLLVFSQDHGGNPFGFASDSTVWLSDHDIGETEIVASSFEEFLRRKCLDQV